MARRLRIGSVRAALIKANGIYTDAAKILDCDRTTVSRFVDRNPKLLDDLEKARAGIVDLAENRLFEEIKNKNVTAIIFALKTLGKDRGYTSRSEHTGPDGGPIAHTAQMTIYLPDNGRDTPPAGTAGSLPKHTG